MKRKYLTILLLMMIIITTSCSLNKKDKTTKNDEVSKKNVEYYVYGIDKVIYSEDGKLSFVSPEEVNWKKFKVYDNRGYAGNYYLQFNNKWYLFDDDRISYKYEAPLFAYYGNDDININDNYEDFIESDIDELELLLQEKGNGDYGALTYAKKISLSSDSTLYIATNIYTSIKDYVFTIVYLKNSNGINILEEFFGKSYEETLMPSYYFEKAFRKSTNDKYNVMILKTYYGNSSNDCNLMYEITPNSSKKLLDCDKIYNEEEKFVVKKEEKTIKKKNYKMMFIIGGVIILIVILLLFITIKNLKANKL